MGEQSCPEFCLVMEVCFCFAQSVASTRWLLQDEMRIANTKCDNCIIGMFNRVITVAVAFKPTLLPGTMIALQYLACLFWILACITGEQALVELARLLDCLAHFTYVTCGHGHY